MCFTVDEIDRSRRYIAPIRVAQRWRAVGSAALFVLVVGTQVVARLVDALGWSNWVVQLFVALLVTEVLTVAVESIFDGWRVLRHDRAWGVSRQSTRGFVIDQGKGLAVSLVFGMVLLTPVYWLARSTASWWWWAWLVTVALVILAGLVVPVFVAPLFARFEPITDEALVARVHEIARRSGVALRAVLVADESSRSTRDNAYVSGLGPTRRMVLYDTILERPPALVDQVVAHELGHARRHHVLHQLPVLAVAAGLVFLVLRIAAGRDGLWELVGADGFADPVGLPLALGIAAAVASAAGLGVSWVSRAHERQADLDALTVLRRPDDTVEMLRSLHVDNLADLEPPRRVRWRASHPPAAERMAFARAWERAVGEPRGPEAVHPKVT